MQENSLHNALKAQFAGDAGQKEVLIDGYYIDVVQADLLIEVQTRSFSSIKPKLAVLMQAHKILLVHPIPVVRWIVHLGADSDQPISRRRSPRKGRIEHVFNELVRFPEFINHPNFSICLVMTHEEEIRQQDGRGSWRRKGVSIVDRNLLKIVGMHYFSDREDFIQLLPEALPSPFTNLDLAQTSALRIELARKMTYCLRQMGALEVAGKQQRKILYKLSQPAYNPQTIPHDGDNYEQ